MAILGDSQITKVETNEVITTKISIEGDNTELKINGKAKEDLLTLISDSKIKNVTTNVTSTKKLSIGDDKPTEGTATQFEVVGQAKIDLLDLIYPVGSIYVYQNGTSAPETCPIQNKLGGTWKKIENRFLYSSSDTSFYGKEGGSNKGYLIKHDHQSTNEEYTSYTQGNGTHTHSFVVHKNNWHTDTSNTSINRDVDVFDIDYEYGTYVPESKGYRGDSSYPLIGQNGWHNHSFTIAKNALKTNTSNTTTSNGITPIDSNIDKANMPQYFGVIAWQRTK